MRQILILILGALWFARAFAASEVSSGGEALVCRGSDGVILSAELLDFFEARELRGIRIDRDAHGETMERKLERMLSSLERLSPTRARVWREQARSFLGDSRFVRGQVLERSRDPLVISLPSGCQVERVVLDLLPAGLDEKRYLIDETLWEKLPAMDQAGLILEKGVQRETSAWGVDVRDLRYFISVLAAGRIDSMKAPEFFSLLFQTRIRDAELDGLALRLFDVHEPVYYGETRQFISRLPEFRADGGLKAAWTSKGASFSFHGKAVELSSDEPEIPTLRFHENGRLALIRFAHPLEIVIHGAAVRVKRELEFHPNGQLLSLILAEEQELPVGDGFSRVRFNGGERLFPGSSNWDPRIHFHDNGVIESGYALSGQARVGEQEVSLGGSAYTRFYPSGAVQAGAILDSYVTIDDRRVKIQPGYVEAYSNGQIAHVLMLSAADFPVGEARRLRFYGSMTFYRSGAVKCGHLQDAAEIPKGDGTMLSAGKSTYLQFTEAGIFEPFREPSAPCPVELN